MNTFKTGLLTLTLGLTAIAAPAHERTATETRSVDFVPLNTMNVTGAEDLHERLRLAAQQVCASAQGVPLSVNLQYRTCVDKALVKAIRQVNQPLVTQAYYRRTKGGTIRIPSR